MPNRVTVAKQILQAVEFILPEQQASFVKELDAHVLKCVKDANGNHVRRRNVRCGPYKLMVILGYPKAH